MARLTTNSHGIDLNPINDNNQTKGIMNRNQRKELRMTAKYLETLADREDLSLEELQIEANRAADDVETMADEEQDKYDNLPDNLQFSSKADEYQDNIDSLNEIVDKLRDIDCAESTEEVHEIINEATNFMYNMAD